VRTVRINAKTGQFLWHARSFDAMSSKFGMLHPFSAAQMSGRIAPHDQRVSFA
jgi:hypothetical protein